MGISVASSATSRTPEQERLGVRMSRGGGLGFQDEMQKLLEELMGGDVEGSEDFDWEGLWNSLMGEEEGGAQEEGSQYPTMFGAPIRPDTFNRGRPGSYW